MPIRQKTLHETPGVCVRLSHYGPGERMHAHGHDHHQISWLLAGELLEESGRSQRELLRAARGVKPADCVHANVYGPQGALLLTASLDAATAARFLPGGALDWSWDAADPAPARALLGLIARGGDIADAALDDLLSLDGQAGPDATSRVPDWLEAVRAQLRDDPDAPELDSLARQHGVHRVHLSRSFTRHFGMAPSLYRVRSRLALGITRLSEGEAPADAAADAGFADQSHFSRRLTRDLGLAPRRLQTLLAA